MMTIILVLGALRDVTVAMSQIQPSVCFALIKLSFTKMDVEVRVLLAGKARTESVSDWDKTI